MDELIDLQERYIELQRRFSDLEQRHQQLRDDVYKARIYAGDNLPAARGLTIVVMLEKALAGESSWRHR